MPLCRNARCPAVSRVLFDPASGLFGMPGVRATMLLAPALVDVLHSPAPVLRLLQYHRPQGFSHRYLSPAARLLSASMWVCPTPYFLASRSPDT